MIRLLLVLAAVALLATGCSGGEPTTWQDVAFIAVLAAGICAYAWISRRDDA